ncbi:MAG: 3-dehydroquinate synthase [Chloroflexi bacterium]|nr:3-dehydroquinate synthase [Chloroflexota bacterium]
MKRNIFITGFSGSGKTSVGKAVARRLGWTFVDTDDLVIESAGKSIQDVFAGEGELAFRELERQALTAASAGDQQVVSTGGGVPMDEANRATMERAGRIICLEARPETIYKRLSQQSRSEREPVVRPMLQATDPQERIRTLKADRQAAYALAHWTVHTDGISTEDAAAEVIRACGILTKGLIRFDGHDLGAVVQTSSGDYPVWVGWDILGELGERALGVFRPSAAFVIHDSGTGEHAARAHRSLEDAGIETSVYAMPSGEKNKTLNTVSDVYRWLAGKRAERKHLLVAVGGGMVGDLVGFVAATYLRGMPFAQVPTSLLAMMDASVGGKVAVDLPDGKNLVGAFHQPRFVLSDVQTLKSLPARELTAGWAEAIKHGLILEPDLLSQFEDGGHAIRSLDPEQATSIIRRSVAVKAGVVSRDEKETLGIRALLNYGHTIGHALEAFTGYSTLLHGEAVSIGMMGAGHISRQMGLLSEAELERQRALLEAFGLPLSYPEVDAEAVIHAMKSDKKTQDKTIHWVLLDGIGNAVTRSDVPPDLVRETLARLAR